MIKLNIITPQFEREHELEINIVPKTEQEF